jgi:uncharacterized protein (TIGR02001 family)
MILISNRSKASVFALVSCALAAPQSLFAAQDWGGSVGFTSDYLVRGVSRSSHDPALQGDLHFATANGFLAGVFASSVQVAPGEKRNAELSAFVGFSWEGKSLWRSKMVASHYSYPWNRAGSKYDYDEFDADVGYSDWVTLSATYSPNAPLYVPYRGLVAVAAKSAELDFQIPLLRKLNASAGVGFSHLAGADGAGYAYWSLGCAYDLAPVTLSLAYVDTSYGATDLYYESAAKNRWTATVIWRF